MTWVDVFATKCVGWGGMLASSFFSPPFEVGKTRKKTQYPKKAQQKNCARVSPSFYSQKPSPGGYQFF